MLGIKIIGTVREDEKSESEIAEFRREQCRERCEIDSFSKLFVSRVVVRCWRLMDHALGGFRRFPLTRTCVFLPWEHGGHGEGRSATSPRPRPRARRARLPRRRIRYVDLVNSRGRGRRACVLSNPAIAGRCRRRGRPPPKPRRSRSTRGRTPPTPCPRRAL